MYTKRKRIRYIYDINEINEKLKFCKSHIRIFKENPDAKNEYNAVPEKERVGINVWWTDKRIAFYLTYKDLEDKVCTYVFDKSESNNKKYTNGGIAYATLKKYYKVPEIAGTPLFSVSGLQYNNKKLNGTRNEAYGYDLNSAFPYAMLQDMPDTSEVPKPNKFVENDEIGFNNKGELVHSGSFANYVFKKMPSPFKRFVEVWYNKKKNSPKNSPEREKAKQMMNYAIGELQNHNFWLRAAIIGYSNELIISLTDKNTIFSNTDSIVSLTERPDLDIGENIGQFKIEHFKEKFAYKGSNYQWENEAPHIKGTTRNWMNADNDLLSDESIKNNNRWIWDREKLKFIENKDWVNNNEEN